MISGVGPLLAEATRRLTTAGTTSPAAEARTLLAAACAVEPGALLAVDPTPEQAARLHAWVERRATGVPVQHLTGVAHFRTVAVPVGPGVFVPRPETEVMVGWALEWLAATAAARGERAARVVELCAGSGAASAAIAAEHQGELEQWAVELDDDAVVWTGRTLDPLGVEVVHGDLADAVLRDAEQKSLDGTVDLVVCNPPYVPLTAWEGVAPEVREHDPAVALFSGEDGLDAIRALARRARALLRPGGVVTAEHAEVQAESAPRVFLEAGGWRSVHDHLDLTGRPRFVTAERVGARRGGRDLAG